MRQCAECGRAAVAEYPADHLPEALAAEQHAEDAALHGAAGESASVDITQGSFCLIHEPGLRTGQAWPEAWPDWPRKLSKGNLALIMRP